MEKALKAKTWLLQHDFIRFCMVGIVGFTVNYLSLLLLHSFVGLPFLAAQLIGAEFALLSNFYFHNTWTYRGHESTAIKTKLIKFHMSSWSGVVILTATTTFAHAQFNLAELPSLMVGSMVTLGWNYGWTKFVIFRKQDPKDTKAVTEPGLE